MASTVGIDVTPPPTSLAMVLPLRSSISMTSVATAPTKAVRTATTPRIPSPVVQITLDDDLELRWYNLIGLVGAAMGKKAHEIMDWYRYDSLRRNDARASSVLLHLRQSMRAGMFHLQRTHLWLWDRPRNPRQNSDMLEPKDETALWTMMLSTTLTQGEVANLVALSVADSKAYMGRIKRKIGAIWHNLSDLHAHIARFYQLCDRHRWTEKQVFMPTTFGVFVPRGTAGPDSNESRDSFGSSEVGPFGASGASVVGLNVEYYLQRLCLDACNEQASDLPISATVVSRRAVIDACVANAIKLGIDVHAAPYAETTAPRSRSVHDERLTVWEQKIADAPYSSIGTLFAFTVMLDAGLGRAHSSARPDSALSVEFERLMFESRAVCVARLTGLLFIDKMLRDTPRVSRPVYDGPRGAVAAVAATVIADLSDTESKSS